MNYLPLVFITSFFVTLFTTPSLIKVAMLKRLFDEPTEERKLHKRITPTIGGIIIFAATLFSFSLWFPPKFYTGQFNYIIATTILLFFVGVKDDIIGTAAVKKLMAHILVGLILVLMAKVKITGLHGVFGMREIPEWAAIFLSLFTYIVIVNAFNLIDGVDGLAAGIGFIASTAFGIWFFYAGNAPMAMLAFSLAGSLLAFLVFNFSPAKIFMGDSGSLVIGLIISILAINMIEYDVAAIPSELSKISRPVLAIAVLVFPLYDTLRIFIYRAVRGKSPFAADKNHIHHRLINLGLSHKQTVAILYLSNTLIIMLPVLLRDMEPTLVLVILAITTLALGNVPFMFKSKAPVKDDKKVIDLNRHGRPIKKAN